MKHHCTEWMESRAICGKAILTVADTMVQEWILKHGTHLSLRRYQGKELTTGLHKEVCDLLCIATICQIKQIKAVYFLLRRDI